MLPHRRTVQTPDPATADQHRLSQDELARCAGISITTIARLERQPTATCRGRTLARLAAALPEQPAAMTLLMAATEDWPLNSPAAGPGR
jgi:transcriptional regulator with XRE-family HTH domain